MHCKEADRKKTESYDVDESAIDDDDDSPDCKDSNEESGKLKSNDKTTPSHTVIRGFSIPKPTSTPPAKLMQAEKQQSKFALCGSSSCGGSLSGMKRQASFSSQFVTREAGDVDESAIDGDDDSSYWEDSNDEGGKSSIDEKPFFQRVDSKVNLTSRRSLITLMLERNDRQVKLGNGASQSTSAIHQGRPQHQGPSFVASSNDSDDNPLMMRGSRAAHLEPINEIPRSAAQPILTSAHNSHYHVALSPRTTRRNMLSTELTESLRRHLIWERSQKSSTVNAVLKRRHTSHDVANLGQYPERVVIKEDTDVNASSYDLYFNRDAGYHSKGW
ncbi:hypothetical protein RB593_001569 [Gaeumannomyces tritici]